MDRLEAEFPNLTWLVVYKAVAAGRVDAARHLPDVQAYSVALEQHARDLLTIAVQSSDVPTYLSGVVPVQE
jgi:hypothetical protein